MSATTDHRTSMNLVEDHEKLVKQLNKINDPIDKEYERTKLLDSFEAEGEKRRKQLAESIQSRKKYTSNVNTNPELRREAAKIDRKIRKIGWHEELWKAMIKGLDLSVAPEWRYLLSMSFWGWAENDLAWKFDEPFKVPPAITPESPTKEIKDKWAPETTLWDIEDAAAYELEIGAGGRGTLNLYDMWSDTDARHLQVDKVRSLVHTYLSYHLARVDALPDDPYDPNEWGHDARIKNLVLHNFSRLPIVFTPSFDPDVLSYTVNEPLIGFSVQTMEFFDPLLTSNRNVVAEITTTSITYTVLARDGSTQRVYKIVVE